jgi:phosphoglycerate transport regulatory protein PgtC
MFTSRFVCESHEALPKKTRLGRSSVASLVGSVFLVSALLGVSARAADSPIVVLTSYPEELTTAYEKAFEQTHPGTDVQIVWQQGRDAMATLKKPDHGGIDVYWAPALFNFPALAQTGTFEKIEIDRRQMPGRIGAQPISDPNGYFEAFEVAGYGIATNPTLLKNRGIAPPKSWDELARPEYSGLVVMPIASRIGFSPQLYDIIVQSKGWDKGWALLCEMAGNAQLTARGGEIVDTIADGKQGAAIAIDFLIRNAISDGKPVSLVYPGGTAFLPAYVAVVASAPHAQEGREFASFLLSNKGQSLLFAPGAARYPIRPDVYANAPQGIVNPFALPEGSTFAYDLNLGPARSPLISALFDAALTSRADRLKTLWTAIHRAEANTADQAARAKVVEARNLAGWVPVTNQQAADLAFLQQFEPQGRELSAAAKALIASWSVQLDDKQTQALRLVSGAARGSAP